MPDYSIVIPVYKSGPWIEELCDRVAVAMEGYRFELILVNDDSPDAVTWPAIVKAAERHSFVRGIDLLYNVGQFRAILAGMEEARGTYVITMDDDLQHPPEELPRLIEAMDDEPAMDCIIGAFKEKKHSLLRNMGSGLFRFLTSRMYNRPKGLRGTNFRIMRKAIAQALVQYRTTRPQIGPMLLQTTTRIKNIPVEHHAREKGRSGYGIFGLINHTIDSVVNASIAPLRAFSLLGFLVAGASFVLAIFYFARWLMGSIRAPGFTTIILLITFFSGMTMAGIGLLGEYVARIITEITGHGRHAVRHRTLEQTIPEATGAPDGGAEGKV